MVKKLFLVIFLTITSTSTFAYDTWKEKTFKSDEVVYYSGFERTLLVGKRGVGLAYFATSNANLYPDEITVRLDDGNPVHFKPIQVVADTLLIDSTYDFVTRVANAKKIEINFRVCFSVVSGCSFSYDGGRVDVEWNFDTTLAQQQPNYLDVIKRPLKARN